MRKPRRSSELSLEIYRLGMLAGILIGFLFLVCGFVLMVLGLTGNVELLMEGQGLKTKLSNSAPGVVFALIGAIIVLRYKPSLKYAQKRDTESDQEEIILKSPVFPKPSASTPVLLSVSKKEFLEQEDILVHNALWRNIYGLFLFNNACESLHYWLEKMDDDLHHLEGLLGDACLLFRLKTTIRPLLGERHECNLQSNS